MKTISAILAIVCLCTIGVSSSYAEWSPEMGLKGAGFEIGLVNADQVDQTFGFGVFANLGTLTPNVMMEAYVDYWQTTEQFFVTSELRFRDIVLGTRAKYAFNVSNKKLTPYAGAGLGVHFLNARYEDSVAPLLNTDVSDTKLGLDIGGGVLAAVSDKASFVGEAWYSFVPDINQFSIKIGMEYALPW